MPATDAPVLAGQAIRGFRSPLSLLTKNKKALCPIACFLLRKKFPARFATPRSLDIPPLRGSLRLAFHSSWLQSSAGLTGI
jgi:hypothetical protein